MSFAWSFNLFTVSGELQEERKDLGILSTDVTVRTVGGSSMFFGTGMRNRGENNCFINATIQVGIQRTYTCIECQPFPFNPLLSTVCENCSLSGI